MMDWEDEAGPDIVESAPHRVPGSYSSAEVRTATLRSLGRLGVSLRRHPRIALAGGLAAVVLATLTGALVSGGTPADPAFVRATNVPQFMLDAARNAPGGYRPWPQPPADAQPLSEHGKPELVYSGAENCPDCATISWALAVALSRFGTFSGVRAIRSQPVGVLRADDTWSLSGASYDSDYLAFSVDISGLPIFDRSVRAVPEQERLASALAASSNGPALDFANRSVWSGPLFPPNLLANRTWDEIAALLRAPGGRPVLAAADNIIAAICQLTHDRPASACDVLGG